MTELITHYNDAALAARLNAGIDAAVPDGHALTIDDLSPVDEFHLRGAAATQELIERLGVDDTARVLDVGSGIGGPARRLAHATGCGVVGIDLCDDYCTIGNELNARVGLADRVELLPGDATDLSRFEGASFDAAWTLHVGMNIADKRAVYDGVARVLRPGATFVVYDILSTGRGAIEYPVPWAGRAEDSHLATRDRYVADLEAAGFRIEDAQESTAGSIAFLDAGRARAQEMDGPPALGLHVIFGPRAKPIFGNLYAALCDGLVVPTMLKAVRAGA